MGDITALRTKLMLASARLSLAAIEKAYNPDQPRAPKGSTGGGKWIAGPHHTGTTNHKLPTQDLPEGEGDHGHPHQHVEKIPTHAFFTPNAVQHPHDDDKGYPVFIRKPSKGGDLSAWGQGNAIATAIPGSPMPAKLNGVAFTSFTPGHDYDWTQGTNPAIEQGLPDLEAGHKRPAAGVIIEEPDGRVWLTRPTNGFGGYHHTFPKGGQEKGMSLQETAVKEAWEETGLKVQLTGVLGDVERTTSVGRYYLAKRVGGTPSDMGWESQALRLVPRAKLKDLLNAKMDHDIVDMLADEGDVEKGHTTSPLALALADAFPSNPLTALADRIAILKGFDESKHPRWPKGSPLGGEFKGEDSHGNIAAPKIGSKTNPEYQAKADAIQGLLAHGDLHNAKLANEKIQAAAAKVHDKAKGGGKLHSHDKWKLQLAQYSQAAVDHADAKGKAETKADAVGVKASGHPTLDSYKKAGAKPGGSNPGGIYTKDGKKYLIKGSNHAGGHQAANEVLASKLLQAAGAGAPNQHVVDLQGEHGGGLGVASEWMDGGHSLATLDKPDIKAAQADFAAHAWLANYDAIGLSHDNTKIIDGKAVNIDPGGALLYRAQGKAKYANMQMPHTADEWNTLRNPMINGPAASVYGSMTHSDLQASAAKLKHMTDDKIGSLVDAYGPADAKIKADLKESLIARRDDILKKAGLDKAYTDAPAAIDQAKAQLAGLQSGALKIGDGGKIEPKTSRGAIFGPGHTPGKDDFTGAVANTHAITAQWHASMHKTGNAEGVDAALDHHTGMLNASGPSGTSQANHKMHVAHLTALKADLEAKTAPTIASGDISIGEKVKGEPFKMAMATPAEPPSMPAFDGKSALFYQNKAVNAQMAHAMGDTATVDYHHGYEPQSATGKNSANYKKFKAYTQGLKDHLDGAAVPEPTHEQLQAAVEAVQPAKSVAPVNASAVPHWDSHLLPTTNTNAASHNAKIDAIQTATEAGDHKAILAMQFGTNTYAKKQVKVANDALKSMGVHDIMGVDATVTTGQKANTHPALTGGLHASQAIAAAKNAGKSVDPAQALPAKPKIIPALTDKELPQTVDFENYKGPGQGLSSKAAVNKQNAELQAQLIAHAKAGDMVAMRAMTFNEINPDGTLTGKVLPIASAKSKHVQQFYKSALEAMDEKANPPEALKVFDPVKAKSIAAIGEAFPSKAPGTATKKIASNEKVGHYIALGQVDATKAITPPKSAQKPLTTNAVIAGPKEYASFSEASKGFVQRIQASSTSFTPHFDDGASYNTKVSTNFGSFTPAEMSEAVHKDATLRPEGTKIFKWDNLTPDFIKDMTGGSLKEGTVLQNMRPMCASYSETATKGFGTHRLNIIHAAGAKTISTFGSGGYSGEKEVSTLPGSRYVYLGHKEVGGHYEIDMLLLPPDAAFDKHSAGGA